MNIPFQLAELLITGLWLVMPLLLVISVVDIVRRPVSVWNAAGQSQWFWAMIVVLVGFFGPLLYFANTAPKLNATTGRANALVGGLTVSH